MSEPDREFLARLAAGLASPWEDPVSLGGG